MTGISSQTRLRIHLRDDHICRRCGKPGNNLQHRRARGMGSSKRPEINADLANLVTLCGSGVTGCHGWATANPAEAERLGWAIPLIDLYGRELFLTDEGGVIYTGRRVEPERNAS